MHFEYGGWCQGVTEEAMLDDCFGRATFQEGSKFGSSKTWSQTYSSDAETTLSSDPALDKVYYNWNRAYFKYCDGTGHQGYRKDPVTHKGYKLHFKGLNVTMT